MSTVKKTKTTGKKPVKAPKASASKADKASAGGVSAKNPPVEDNGQTPGVRRRDFIHIATVSFAGVGAAAVAMPLVSQMSASADVLALASIEVDVAAIQPGQSIKTSWRKQPVFIRNLTAAEIEEANKVDVGALRDPQTLAERTKPGKENWLITLGVCTHLGCVPLGAAAGEVKGEYGGYFCPCHGSHYDTAARIRKGPAPLNLVVPEFAFISDTVVKIG
jgi:ubiquinol-cytochrome c reductase iron-sulfur subunit